MFFALIFVITRIGQILTLIPTVGMLAWFVEKYNNANALTPSSILVLFIVSVLALAWAIFTLFSYHRSSTNARFIAFVDLCFVGALIAGVYYLRGIADADCTNFSYGDSTWTRTAGDFSVSGPSISWNTNKPCVMLKAAFAFGIINIIWFAVTALFAFWHGGRLGAKEEVYVSRGHHHRRHSRRRSRSGSRTYSSHRSPHSHRRVYV